MNKMEKKPAVVFTLDFELGWGSIENGKWAEREAKGVYKRLRNIIPELGKIFSRLEIPSTWGIVGAMNEPQGSQQMEHLPDKFRGLARNALRKGQAQTFDGRDLIEKLAKESRYIRLCSHTYSHTKVDSFRGNEKLFEQEMRLFEKATKSLPVERKLIFPQNIEGFYNVLISLDYKKIRGSETGSSIPNGIIRLKNNLFDSPPASCFSKIGATLIRETGSLFFNARSSRLRRMLLSLQTRRGIRKIMNNEGVLHIYNHPFNLAEDSMLYRNYLMLLHEIAEMRDKNLIRTCWF